MNSLFQKIQRRLVKYYLNIASFEYWQKNGYHVLRNYYYSPIPDTRNITSDFFEKQSELKGLDLRLDSQVKLLERFATLYRSEYEKFPEKPINEFDYHKSQTSYHSLEAQILYCYIRDLKPKKIIEIGSGYSTMLTALAVRTNQELTQNDACEFIAIEPYPNDIIKKGFKGLSKLISLPVEKVNMSEFESLSENDILFIDSSHTVRSGGDVVYEILEILPRLKKGVYIHIHDIFFPDEYPKEFFDIKRFWAEQYLVQAFLCFNDSFEITWTSHYMSKKYPELIKKHMSFYDPKNKFISSLWIKKIK